ncbi:MAG: hypothetical protein V1652_02225 [bacterium]
MEENKGSKKGLIIAILIIVALAAVTAYAYSRRNSKISLKNNTPGGIVTQNATVDSIDIKMLESLPIQVQVTVQGTLPDGCTSIDDVTQRKSGNTFFITVKSNRPSDVECTQVIAPYEKNVELNVYGLKTGIYTVDVNGVTNTFEFKQDNIPQGNLKG